MTPSEEGTSTGCGGLLSGLAMVACFGYVGFIVIKDFGPQWVMKGKQYATAYACKKKLEATYEGPFEKVNIGWASVVNEAWPLAIVQAQNDESTIRALCKKGEQWHQWFSLEPYY